MSLPPPYILRQAQTIRENALPSMAAVYRTTRVKDGRGGRETAEGLVHLGPCQIASTAASSNPRQVMIADAQEAISVKTLVFPKGTDLQAGDFAVVDTDRFFEVVGMIRNSFATETLDRYHCTEVPYQTVFIS